jgi:hypothetical protein
MPLKITRVPMWKKKKANFGRFFKIFSSSLLSIQVRIYFTEVGEKTQIDKIIILIS